MTDALLRTARTLVLPATVVTGTGLVLVAVYPPGTVSLAGFFGVFLLGIGFGALAASGYCYLAGRTPALAAEPDDGGDAAVDNEFVFGDDRD